jgi:lipopolysaccharide export system permease protein
MKILYRYIIKEHLNPFFGALIVIMFIFLLQFLVKFIGQIFGKGLSLFIILELITLNLAWMMALAVPMSTLIAVLMAFGRLSADNEITILKSSGISIYRTIRPSIVFGLIITVIMVYFNDQILPDANHEARKMFSAIKQKKPTLSIEENIFYDLAGYSFVVDQIEKPLTDEWLSLSTMLGPEYKNPEHLDRLKNVTIFDRSSPTVTVTINAENGYMVYSKEKKALIFTLFNGEFHELDFNKIEEYQHSEFEKNVVYIPAQNFELESENSNYRSDREMNIKQMQQEVAKNRDHIVSQQKKTVEDISQNFKVLQGLFTLMNNDSFKIDSTREMPKQIIDIRTAAEKRAIRQADRHRQRMKTNYSIVSNYQRNVNKYNVEIHKKLSIPFASIMFILVGAPLGIMARKGSMGIATLLSMGFFVLYWAFLIGGEKLADRQFMSPFWAMWAPNFIVFFAGLFLIWRAVKESSFIDWEKIIHFFTRRRKVNQTSQNENT